MSQNITIAGASYPDVPSIEIPKTDGEGMAVFSDTSDATATAEDILNGKTAYVGGMKVMGMGTGGGVTPVQPDWNQNNPEAPDYVKNRPFYEGEPELVTLMEETTLTFNSGQAVLPVSLGLTTGNTYFVTWDNIEYECVCEDARGIPALGNPWVIHMPGYTDNGLPFLIGESGGQAVCISLSEGDTHEIKVVHVLKSYVEISSEYLPKATNETPGILKSNAFAKLYKFGQNVTREDFEIAINDFTQNGAFIIWDGSLIIKINMTSFPDSMEITFATEPTTIRVYSKMTNNNRDYFYNKQLYSDVIYTLLQVGNVFLSGSLFLGSNTLSSDNILPIPDKIFDDDNGKIAQIVNGKWTAVSIDTITDAVIAALPDAGGESF